MITLFVEWWSIDPSFNIRMCNESSNVSSSSYRVCREGDSVVNNNRWLWLTVQPKIMCSLVHILVPHIIWRTKSKLVPFWNISSLWVSHLSNTLLIVLDIIADPCFWDDLLGTSFDTKFVTTLPSPPNVIYNGFIFNHMYGLCNHWHGDTGFSRHHHMFGSNFCPQQSHISTSCACNTVYRCWQVGSKSARFFFPG